MIGHRKLLAKLLDAVGDMADFFIPGTEPGGPHQLEVVHDHQGEITPGLEPPAPGPELQRRKARGVVYPDWRIF